MGGQGWECLKPEKQKKHLDLWPILGPHAKNLALPAGWEREEVAL